MADLLQRITDEHPEPPRPSFFMTMAQATRSEFYRSPCNLFMARRMARPAARALSSLRAICRASLKTLRAALAAISLARGLEASFCAA